MDNKRLRQLAGLTETKAKTKKTAAKLNEDTDLFRKLAGLPAIVKEEGDDEESKMPEDEELPSIVTKISAKVEGKTGDELTDLINKVYDAGFADGKASCETEEVKESAPLSDTLAAKKIFDKIKGTPNLKISSVEQMVKQYLSMVGKTERDVKFLTANVVSLLQDAGMMESVQKNKGI